MSAAARAFSLIMAAALLLSGCGGNKPQLPQAAIKSALRTETRTAEPSAIVAAEIALSQMAQKLGEDKAIAAFGYAEDGTAPRALFRDNDDEGGAPLTSLGWKSKRIWMSCDGSAAISDGRYRDGAGKTGYYAMVWRRRGDGTYRLLYRKQEPDMVQKPRAATPASNNNDEILVKAIESVQAYVADCPAPNPFGRLPKQDGGAPSGAKQTSPPEIPLPPKPEDGEASSKDGTLRWWLRDLAGGAKSFRAEFLENSIWKSIAIKPDQ